MFYPVRVLFEGRRRRGTVDFYKDEQKQAKDYVYGPACFFCVLRQSAPVCRQESDKEVEHVRIKSGTGAHLRGAGTFQENAGRAL